MKQHRFNRMKTSTLLHIAAEEIRNRDLSLPTGWGNIRPDVRDKQQSMFLVGRQYWYKYSSRVGSYYIGGAYLVGQDDGQLFAVRVPAPTKTVEEALEYITPAAVKNAQQAGKETHRQGDIFFVEMRLKEDDMTALEGTRHTYKKYQNAGGKEWYRWVTHPQHPPVVLPKGKHFRAFQSTQVEASGRRGGD